MIYPHPGWGDIGYINLTPPREGDIGYLEPHPGRGPKDFMVLVFSKEGEEPFL